MLLPLLALMLAAQDAPLPPPAANPPRSAKPANRLPPANPLPYQDPDAAAVMAPIDALLAGLTARDAQAILAVTDPEGRITAVEEKPDGTRAIRTLGWNDYAGAIRPGAARIEERLSTPAIEVDGDIAMVWAPYVFLIDGKPHHCGTNHFDMVRQAGGWKLRNVTYTHRTTGCEVR